MNLLIAHTRAEVVTERDQDLAAGTLLDSYIPDDGRCWVDYWTRNGNVVRLEYDPDE